MVARWPVDSAGSPTCSRPARDTFGRCHARGSTPRALTDRLPRARIQQAVASTGSRSHASAGHGFELNDAASWRADVSMWTGLRTARSSPASCFTATMSECSARRWITEGSASSPSRSATSDDDSSRPLSAPTWCPATPATSSPAVASHGVAHGMGATSVLQRRGGEFSVAANGNLQGRQDGNHLESAAVSPASRPSGSSRSTRATNTRDERQYLDTQPGGSGDLRPALHFRRAGSDDHFSQLASTTSSPNLSIEGYRNRSHRWGHTNSANCRNHRYDAPALWHRRDQSNDSLRFDRVTATAGPTR